MLIWLHTISDSVIALSYFAIPLVLFFLAWRYRVKRLSGVFAVYGAFILGCGTTHVFDVVTVHYANRTIYIIDGIIRALTSVVSVAAAVVTIRCAADALVLFTRLSVLEERMGARLKYLTERGEKDTLWVKTLTEMREITNRITRMAPPEV